MKESSKLIGIIRDIEVSIIGIVFADLSYRHDGFGRPNSHKQLSDIHAKLCSLPSMVKVKKEADKLEKELCEKYGYEFSPLFRTIEEMEERGKVIFNDHIKEKEGKNLE